MQIMCLSIFGATVVDPNMYIVGLGFPLIEV